MAEHESLLTDKEREALELHEALPRARALEAWMVYAALNGFETERVVEGVDLIRNMPREKLKQIRKDLAAATRLLDYMTMAAIEVDTEDGDHATLSLVERLSSSVADETESDLDQEADEPSQDEQLHAADEAELVIEDEPTAIPDEPIEALTDTTQLATEAIVDDLIPEASMRWVRESLKIEVPDDISLEDMVQKIIQIANPPASRMGKGHNGNYINAAERVRQKLLGKTYAQISSLEEGSTPGAVQQWFAVRIIRPFKHDTDDIETTQGVQSSLAEAEAEAEAEPEVSLDTYFTNRKRVVAPVEADKLDEPHEVLAVRFADITGFDSAQKAAFFGYINPRPTGKDLTPGRERMITDLKVFIENTLAPLPVVFERFDREQAVRLQYLLGISLKDGKVSSAPKFQHVDMLDYAQRNGHDTARVSESLFRALENLADMLEEALTDPAVAN